GDPDGPAVARVFKVERGAAGEKVALARMVSGTAHVRDRVALGDGREGKVTAIAVYDRGGAERRSEVGAGRIARLWGLADVRVGDTLGARAADDSELWHFAPPTLETVVVPAGGTDRRSLRIALERLADEDPRIALRQDEARGEVSLSLYGEVQKEVVQATLARDFGVDVTF